VRFRFTHTLSTFHENAVETEAQGPHGRRARRARDRYSEFPTALLWPGAASAHFDQVHRIGFWESRADHGASFQVGFSTFLDINICNNFLVIGTWKKWTGSTPNRLSAKRCGAKMRIRRMPTSCTWTDWMPACSLYNKLTWSLPRFVADRTTTTIRWSANESPRFWAWKSAPCKVSCRFWRFSSKTWTMMVRRRMLLKTGHTWRHFWQNYRMENITYYYFYCCFLYELAVFVWFTIKFFPYFWLIFVLKLWR